MEMMHLIIYRTRCSTRYDGVLNVEWLQVMMEALEGEVAAGGLPDHEEMGNLYSVLLNMPRK